MILSVFQVETAFEMIILIIVFEGEGVWREGERGWGKR